MGSRGSVIPFLNEAKKGEIPITDKKMTRFNITLKESIDLVLYSINNSIGREIFVPPSYNIIDLAEAIGPSCKMKFIGIRPGEKIHEEMITEDESLNTFENSKSFIVFSTIDKSEKKKIEKHFNAKIIKKDLAIVQALTSIF